MLKQRVLTALIGLPILLFALTQGPYWVLALLFTVFIGLSVFEISTMILPRMELLFVGVNPATSDAKHPHFFDILLIQLLGLTMFFSYALMDLNLSLSIIVTCIMASMLLGALLAKDIDTAMGHAMGYLFSLSYGVLPWLLIWNLTLHGEHARFLILLLAIVWGGDTGAYFGGRFFGKHQLAPKSSPKKTWEGAVAGLLTSAFGGYCANWYWEFSLGSTPVILLVSLAGGFCGQLGDLVESTFKRFARIKDSGAFLPGHGGFLDRCDALLYAGPIVWLVLIQFNGVSH